MLITFKQKLIYRTCNPPPPHKKKYKYFADYGLKSCICAR